MIAGFGRKRTIGGEGTEVVPKTGDLELFIVS